MNRAELFRYFLATTLVSGFYANAEVATSASGTGWFVTQQHVVTCTHVVEGAQTVEVFLPSASKMVPVKLVARDKEHDVALLKLSSPDPSVTPLRLRAREADVGEKVFTVGYPLVGMMGGEAKFTEGSVSARSGIGGVDWQLQISVPIQNGNSGGALLDEKGEVLGVVSSSLSDLATLERTGTLPQSVNYAVKAKYILPLLKHVGIELETVDGKQLQSRKEAISIAQQATVFVRTEMRNPIAGVREQPAGKPDDGGGVVKTGVDVYLYPVGRFYPRPLRLNGVNMRTSSLGYRNCPFLLKNVKANDILYFNVGQTAFVCVDEKGYFLFASDRMCQQAIVGESLEFMKSHAKPPDMVRLDYRLADEDAFKQSYSQSMPLTGAYLDKRSRAWLRRKVYVLHRLRRAGGESVYARRIITAADLRPNKDIKLNMPVR